MYTGVTSLEESKKTLLLFTRKLQKTLTCLASGELSISFGKDIITLTNADVIRVVSEIPVKCSGELVIRNMLLEAVIQCETHHKLSGLILCFAFCEFIKVNNSKDSIEKDLSYLSKLSKKATLDEALRLIQKTINDDLARSILLNAVKLSGADGTITLNTDPCTETHIKTFTGYHFSVATDELFARSSKLDTWTRNNVLCLIIDGVIERASEVEKIMYQLSESKQSCIIFARGFSEEVSSTLAVNFLRNHLDIIPIKVPFDELGINLINDIAYATESDIVSSLKGDLISQKTIDDLSMLETVSIKGHTNTCVIYNKKTRHAVHRHLNVLKESYDDLLTDFSEENKARQSLLEKRINSLSGDGVEIKIGKSIGQRRGLTIDRIQSGISVFKDVCRHGLIDLKNVKLSNKSVSTALKPFVDDKIPTLSLLSGLSEGLKLSTLIKNMGCIIYLDN